MEEACHNYRAPTIVFWETSLIKIWCFLFIYFAYKNGFMVTLKGQCNRLACYLLIERLKLYIVYIVIYINWE